IMHFCKHFINAHFRRGFSNTPLRERFSNSLSKGIPADYTSGQIPSIRRLEASLPVHISGSPSYAYCRGKSGKTQFWRTASVYG
ncbi:MAG: hypothetical protein IKK82_00735, partial [Kiritimatiellae bacterium]|nr:hypothetical protein [Kiritimatiellia bacterium]